MDPRIKTLLSFLTVEKPEVLLSSCSMKDEKWVEDIGAKSVKCTSAQCEEEDETCIKTHPTGMYLPMNRFDVWIINPEEFPYTLGYAFHLGASSLRKFGLIVLTSLPDDAMDSVALSYGFQILYHGDWHYYLKSA